MSFIFCQLKKERRTGGKTFFFPPRHAVSRPSQKRDLQEHDRGRWRTVVCVDLKSIREEYGRGDPEAVSLAGARAARSRGAIWRGVEKGTSRFELLATTVCFFTIATKDDGTTQLIYITIISTVDRVGAYCLAFMPISSKIFRNDF